MIKLEVILPHQIPRSFSGRFGRAHLRRAALRDHQTSGRNIFGGLLSLLLIQLLLCATRGSLLAARVQCRSTVSVAGTLRQ